MLGVGWLEMLLIGVVALIVIGPKELPALMQKLGRFAGTIRRMGADFQRELNKTTGLEEVRNLRTAITQPLKQTTDAIRKEFNTIGASGAVTPSGVIRPADPKAESVVDEIKAAAGITAPQTPAAAMKEAVTKAAAAPGVAAAAAPIAVAPVKAKRVTRAKAAPTAPVKSADLAPVPAKPAPKKPAAKAKPVESPAPVEALAPAGKPAKAKPAPAAEPKPAASKASRKPAAKKA
jgi:sec-independent protein translocase protein TatB